MNSVLFQPFRLHDLVLSNRIVSSAVLGPRGTKQLEDLVREVGMGPVYLRDEDLMRVPRALENVGIEP